MKLAFSGLDRYSTPHCMDEDFAVIETGGKQYRVSQDSTIRIEKITGTFNEGDALTFDKVLLTQKGDTTTVGKPYVSGATVTGTLMQSARAKKVVVIKYKAKSRYFKKRGHRQPYFQVKIENLN